MERDKNTEENVEEVEPVELLLFQVPECYVYMVNFIPALIFFLYFCSMYLYVALKHAFFVFGFLGFWRVMYSTNWVSNHELELFRLI